jgi:hypothetical protein
MARRRGSSVAAPLAAAVVLGAGGWFAWQHRAELPRMAGMPAAAPTTPATRTEPPVDGRPLTLSGTLRVTRPARDTQLGIGADAVALLRRVEMLQWQESCAGARCDHALAWSEKPIDSRAFRQPQGHQNPPSLPFSSERFLAGELRLGTYVVDPALAAEGAEAVSWPVRTAQLPPNLAATFREQDGALYAGDPAHPAAGDLRVSYRIVAAGERRLSGVASAGRLKAAATR